LHFSTFYMHEGLKRPAVLFLHPSHATTTLTVALSPDANRDSSSTESFCMSPMPLPSPRSHVVGRMSRSSTSSASSARGSIPSARRQSTRSSGGSDAATKLGGGRRFVLASELQSLKQLTTCTGACGVAC
jgi:hypothetical protein